MPRKGDASAASNADALTLKEFDRFADNRRNGNQKGLLTMSDAVIEHMNDTGVRTALGTLLIESGHLDSGRLDEALRIGADTGERLGEVVVRMGWASEDDLAKTLAKQWHLRYIERSAISFDAAALSRMSREEATRLEALPMQVSADGAVIVALAEPTDARILALRSLLGDRIDCVVVAKTAIDAGLRSELLAKNTVAAPEVASAPEPHYEPVELIEPVETFTAVETASTTDSGENGLFPVSTEVPDVTTHDAAVIDAPTTFDEVVVTDEHPTSDFDELAKTLSDGLSAQLGSLRGIVVEAESARQRDAVEIARLTSELAARTSELADRTQELNDRTNELNDRTNELGARQVDLADRNETIVTMQQKLRELADTLDHTS